MVESLQKLREPAVVVLLATLLVRLFVAVLALAGWLPGTGGLEGQTVALARVSVTDPLTVVVLVLLLGSCVLWSPTQHARTLTRVALAVVAAGVLVYAGAGVAWLAAWPVPGRGYQVVDLLLGLVLPLLALLALGVLSRSGSQVAPAGQASLASVPVEAQPALPQRRTDPDSEPTWQPDEASGAVWLTAGDAAAGAAASTWGTPGEAGGWTRPGDQAASVTNAQQEERRDERSRDEREGEARSRPW